MKITARIFIIVALQTFALAAMIGMKQWTLTTGTPIVLETVPYDPRSLFSGDYARLNYRISTLPVDQLTGDHDFRTNQTIYVLLVKEDTRWTPVSVHHRYPQVPADHVAIKGRVAAVTASRWNPSTNQSEKGETLWARYGIETYFVPEGTGHRIDRPGAGNRVSVEVAVDRYGNAGIKAVLINGERRYEETLF